MLSQAERAGMDDSIADFVRAGLAGTSADAAARVAAHEADVAGVHAALLAVWIFDGAQALPLIAGFTRQHAAAAARVAADVADVTGRDPAAGTRHHVGHVRRCAQSLATRGSRTRADAATRVAANLSARALALPAANRWSLLFDGSAGAGSRGRWSLRRGAAAGAHTGTAAFDGAARSAGRCAHGGSAIAAHCRRRG